MLTLNPMTFPLHLLPRIHPLQFVKQSSSIDY